MSSLLPQQNQVQEDAWASLRQFTAARIALGRTGVAVPLQEALHFKLSHAHARDAVYSLLQAETLATACNQLQLPVYQLYSKAANRSEYLQRPDLGRQLEEASAKQLLDSVPHDIAIVLADGLSATAINHNAIPLLQLLIPRLSEAGFSLAPIVIVQQARVAIGDTIGSLLQAKLVLVLIGERPGLSSADSMGAYITYHPHPGLTDESRNCVSNIRPEGLNYSQACDKLLQLIKESLRLQLSGVQLKDEKALSI